jgi:hypothetical protein
MMRPGWYFLALLSGAVIIIEPLDAQQMAEPQGVRSLATTIVPENNQHRVKHDAASRSLDAERLGWSAIRTALVGGIGGAVAGGIVGHFTLTHMTCPNSPDVNCSGKPTRNTSIGAVYGAFAGAIGGFLLHALR